MDSSNIQRRLLELRHELKEILSMIEATSRSAARPTLQQLTASPINQHEVVPETPEDPCDGGEFAPDGLFDDALVVVTEFGQASPAVLQMWLSIDYGRAMRILREFETQGFVSSRGKVRHKAYALRRSKGMEFRL